MNPSSSTLEQFLYHRLENLKENANYQFKNGSLTEANLAGILYNLYEQVKRVPKDVEFLQMLPHEILGPALAAIIESKSQVRQDIFVLAELGFKTGGIFVEFGATDGCSFSNSWLLENFYNWSGILSEPARCWHDRLVRSRKCIIDSRCVWTETGKSVLFKEAPVAELSTIVGYGEDDEHAMARKHGSSYAVETISLNDLLAFYNAPSNLDYLSIDTEGSEFDILSQLNFERYQFKVITCEHNFTPMREKIYALLTSVGYVRKFTEASFMDDWYVRA